jgi:hypothetical protein
MVVVTVLLIVVVVVFIDALGVLVKLFNGVFRRSLDGFRCHKALLFGRLL